MYSTNHSSIPKRSNRESNAAIPWILLRMLIFINVLIRVIFIIRKYALRCFIMRHFMYGLVRIWWGQVRIGYVVALGYIRLWKSRGWCGRWCFRLPTLCLPFNSHPVPFTLSTSPKRLSLAKLVKWVSLPILVWRERLGEWREMEVCMLQKEVLYLEGDVKGSINRTLSVARL